MAEFESTLATSLSLIARVRDLEPEAWTRFTKLYGPVVYGWARRMNIQDSDAADVAQEVFQAVAFSLDRFEQARASGGFRGWLWGVTRNKINEHIRKRSQSAAAAGGSTVNHLLKDLPDAPPGDDEESGESDARLARRALNIIRTDFQENTWNAFWRTAVDGLPAGAVAAELQMSVAAVYKARSRVLRHLRTEMEGLLE